MQTEVALAATAPMVVPDGEFATSDIYFAATLIALGMELVGLDRANPQRVRFVFADDEGTQTIVKLGSNASRSAGGGRRNRFRAKMLAQAVSV